jgi:hypothetical protein
MEKSTAQKAYAVPGMYREGKELLNFLVTPRLENGMHLLDELCIVTEGPCPVKNLRVGASDRGVPIHISEDVIKAENGSGLVILL